MTSAWLHVFAVAWLVASIASAALVVADLFPLGHRQAMWIMDVVWPVTALWAGPLGLVAYLRWGRAGERRAADEARRAGREPPGRRQPFPVLAGKGTTHCGAGCTLGDLAAELLAVALPFSILGHALFGAWVYDFVLAFAFGIAFQFFTIRPMRGLLVREGLREAFKADALSLTAWQVGMYGWMALATFVFFGRELPKSSVVFWFMMQLAMCAGFLTSYPVNWWLLRRGVKEAM